MTSRSSASRHAPAAEPVSTTLIIPAAGSGSRFGAPLPKQLQPLHGSTVLGWSLAAFSGLVDDAVIAVSDDVRAGVAGVVAQARLPFPVELVAGGATRMDSVCEALSRARGDLVLVHDAVRPLVPRSCIEACIAALADKVAAVVAVPCASTVKRARGGHVVETVPRDELWLAQTPQGFHRDAGIAAFARARTERWTCSDDAQVLERAGFDVVIVSGDARNLKITTPDDLVLAEALLASNAT